MAKFRDSLLYELSHGSSSANPDVQPGGSCSGSDEDDLDDNTDNSEPVLKRLQDQDDEDDSDDAAFQDAFPGGCSNAGKRKFNALKNTEIKCVKKYFPKIRSFLNFGNLSPFLFFRS